MAFPLIGTAVEQLQGQVEGSVLMPDHPDYDATRRGYNLSIDHHPALILISQNAQDIVAGVRFARDAGLGVAVQATGHGQQAEASEDSILILTSEMKGVRLDASARRVWAEAGVIWEQIVETAAPHGLAPLLGSSPHVGVVGYSLGGGIGWLARKYGLAADSVRSVDLVTADGVLHHASPTENSDLFWGVRGGAGNFGVVTALEFELFPVAKVYGGNLVYPADSLRDALRFFRDWVKTVPDELTSSLTLFKFPNAPVVPEALRGTMQVLLRAVYAGAAADGERWIQKWIDWRAPLNNSFVEIPFDQIGTVSNDPTDPAAVSGSNEMIDELSADLIDVIVRYATDSKSPFVINELRHAGGAIRRVPADANAIGNRDAEFYLTMGGRTPTQAAYDFMQKYFRQYKADLKPHVSGGVYLNFHSNDDTATRAKDAYLPESYQRLLALKAKYDPDNMFRYSYPLVTD